MREWADWFCVLFVTAALAVALLGAAEALEMRDGALEAASDARTEAPSAPEPAGASGAPTVLVDAGHGGMDGGAVGTDTGVVEATLNLAVAELVRDGLTEKGCTVVMTRTDGEALADTKQADIRRRKELIGQSGIDLVVSIHMNSFTDRSISGPMAYYMLGSAEGQKLAQRVIDCLTDATQRERRLANPGDYFVIRACACPAVLVECGFLTNSEDERRLQEPEYRLALAEAVVEGIASYFVRTNLPPGAANP